ncbi:MAG: hypothetical protein AAFP84_08485 [Actinomycetota bacterium]
MSLVARHLESNGIPTVVVGSARDIVEECGVPRFLFVDYPLGNPTGKPGDVDDQRSIVSLALDVLESARFPRSTVQAPNRWRHDGWRDAFMAVTDENREALAAAGERRRAKQAEQAAACAG